MTCCRPAVFALLLLAIPAASRAEILVRWTQDDVPAPQVLGLHTLVIPAERRAAVRAALAQGYRVYLDTEAARLATLTLPAAGLAGVTVRGNATRAQLAALRQRLAPLNARAVVLDERGKWPHIRSNWVTKNNDVLQVAGRSAQPWIETNAALIAIARSGTKEPAALTYQWAPLTLSDVDEGPALENYLVAVSEAGSFGADLVLPLHERLQRRLLLGHPDARREWNEIRRCIEFYSDNLPRRYEPVATIGVVTSSPMVWFEVMNLLARHNLSFELIAPSQLPERRSDSLKLLIVLDAPDAPAVKALAEFERRGGRVIVVAAPTSDPGTGAGYASRQTAVVERVADPNRFALDVRRQLGRDSRAIEIWNGITVLAAPYKEPDGDGVLVTVLNYAYQPLPVQLRVAGRFAQVYFESPDEPSTLLPHEPRDGHTEFVVPALRVGGRIFLRHGP